MALINNKIHNKKEIKNFFSNISFNIKIPLCRLAQGFVHKYIIIQFIKFFYAQTLLNS